MKRIAEFAVNVIVLAAAIGVIAILPPTSGCAWWNKTAGPAIYDCSTDAMKQIESNLMQVIASVLKDQNWEEELLGLEQQLGADGISMITCIVMHILNPPPSGLPKALPPLAQNQRDHGQAWIAKYGGGRK